MRPCPWKCQRPCKARDSFLDLKQDREKRVRDEHAGSLPPARAFFNLRHASYERHCRKLCARAVRLEDELSARSAGENRAWRTIPLNEPESPTQIASDPVLPTHTEPIKNTEVSGLPRYDSINQATIGWLLM